MADTETHNTAHAEEMKEVIAAFRDGSKIKGNGVRDVPKAVYAKQLESRGVTDDEVRRVRDAEAFLNTAGAHTAVADLESKIKEMSKDDLSDDEKRRKLSATVRLPTHIGSTDITVGAEAYNPIPFRPDADGNGEQQFKTTHGRLRVSVNTKGHIHKDFHDEASLRIRKSLGLD